MSWWRKITRILWKTMLFSVLFLLAIGLVLFFAFQTETFQTWAAKQATQFLSGELSTRVDIKRVKISFVKNVTLEGIFVGDQHGDTLASGESIKVNVSDFSFSKQQLNLNEAELNGIKIKLLKYKGEKDFNFQFLADYFASTDSLPQDTTPSKWKLTYGDLKLNNVDFTYRLLRDTDKVVSNMNYNNIHATNVYGKFSDLELRKDTIIVQVTGLKAKEQCGVVLDNLTSKVTLCSTMLKCDNLYLKTPNSLVKGGFSFNYDTWEDYTDFVNKVYVKANLKDSTSLNMKDVTYFAEDLNGFEEVFKIKGKVKGFVNDLNGSGLYVKYGKHTEFFGDITMTGLPDIDKTFIHFDAEKLSTSKEDLEQFPIPPFNNHTHLDLPVEVAKLGVINYVGKFDGFINSFVTYGKFKTAIGDLKTDLQLVTNPKTNILEYTGKLSSNNFYLAKLLPNLNKVGPISLDAKIKGKGVTLNELDVQMEGVVNSISVNNYAYNNLSINGNFKKRIFNGQLVSLDPNADFDFNGTVDFNNKVPKMDFISTINNFDLEKTNLSTPQLNGKLSSQILINLHGDDIDNLTGQINFDNTNYINSEKKYKLSTFNLVFDQENQFKNITLSSNIVNAQLSGKYNLSSLSNAFKQYLNSYFPTFVKTNTRYIYRDEADLKVKIKNFTIVKELFLKNVMFSPNTTLDASFDAAISYLNVATKSDVIELSGVKFKNNTLNVNSLPNGISLDYVANSINLTDSLAFKNPSVKITANDKKSDFAIVWNSQHKPLNAGEIAGNILFGNTSANLKLEKANFTVVDSVWQLVKQNDIVIDTAFVVRFNPITFYNQNQLITLDGKLSKSEKDRFDVLIQNFKLSQFNGLLSDAKMKLDGTITGNTNVYSAFDKTILNSDLGFSSLKLNNKLIGNGEIKSEYNPEKDLVSINGFSAFAKDLEGNLLKNIEFQGFYYPKKTEENLDVTFKAEPFDVSLLQPYLEDIITIKMGYLNGTGQITGTPAKPQINAKLKFFKCVMLVDFLNVQYSVNGFVDIRPNQINFDNLEIRDKMGNSGSVYGNIFHNNFRNMRIDFDINTNKLMVLNTTSANNPTYYGTAYASGNAGIYGFLDDIRMEMNMKTNGGTYFYIPLDGPSEIGSNEFIRFVSKDTIKPVVQKTPSNFSLDFNLEATPDAEVQLIFDEKSGDVIKAKGAGNLHMKINTKGKFDMFGEYELATGDYLFTLENFVTKKFEIQKGSTIKWNGDVYNANIDITAIYRQRASVKPLFPNDSLNDYSKRFPVDCKLFMKDKLTQPNISFGIDLPTIDESTRSNIKSLLIDENELNRQVFSLLLLRSFVTPLAVAGGGGVTAGNAVAATSSEMLSNKISNWLNGMTKEVDIGVNYRPGNSLSSDELDLALSKQLFNNRLVIDGNFGVSNRNNTTKTTNSNNSNIIGDVTLEYKLSETGKYRVKGFNRSNDNTQVLYSGGPFTQGVGIFYREEYENLSELFRRYLDKVKKKK